MRCVAATYEGRKAKILQPIAKRAEPKHRAAMTARALLPLLLLCACKASVSPHRADQVCRIEVPGGWLRLTQSELPNRQTINTSAVKQGYLWAGRLVSLPEIAENLERLKTFHPPPLVIVDSRASSCEEGKRLAATLASSGYCSDFNCAMLTRR